MIQLLKQSKIRLFALTLLFLLFFPTLTASAQVKSFHWKKFDSHMTLLANGDVEISETQTLVFSGDTFTFGFRTIPTGLEGQNDGIEVISLREGDNQYREVSNRTPGTYTVRNDNDEVRIDWYFEPAIGERTYTITYLVRNPVIVGTLEEGDGDQIFWKPLPPDLLSSRVEQSRVTLVLPRGVAPQQYFDGSGYLAEGTINGNSNAVTTTVSEDGRTVTFTANEFIYSGDVFETRTQIPHGALQIPESQWQRSLQRNDATQLTVVVIAVLFLFGGPLGVLALWYVRGRDPELSITPPEYITEPPSNLPPALVGTLVDERADMRDILSSIVDLGERGYLTIKEMGRNDYAFTKESTGKGELRKYERYFYNRIFRQDDWVELDDLKYKFHTAIPKIQNMLYDELVALDYVPASPQSTRNSFAVLGWGVLILGGVSTFVIAGFLPEAIAGVALCPGVVIALTGAMLIYVSRHMPRKTRKGAEEAAKWDAFKNYLQRIEKLEDIEQATEKFEKYLAYATAFGIERSWIRKFARIPHTPPPPWYYPYSTRGGYGYGRSTSSSGPIGGGEGGRPSLEGMSGNLAGGLSSMSSGLTRMLNSSSRVMKSTPPSQSSGGSSGGFSGGFSGGGGFSSGGGGSAGFG
ncbi:MAG: DUF2207 domain-containing protein [Chloroflexota bacterium]